MSFFLVVFGWLLAYKVYNIILSGLLGFCLGFLIGEISHWPRSVRVERWLLLLMFISPAIGIHTTLLKFSSLAVHLNIFLFGLFLTLSVRRFPRPKTAVRDYSPRYDRIDK
jgi:hypothetical protein